MEQPVKCVIVDDEPLARDIIEKYINDTAGMELQGSFSNLSLALDLLSKNETDILFLDIEMPVYSGFEFIEKLESRPVIIFCTAFDEYAVKAFEYGVSDYLLKPVSYTRFLNSLSKVMNSNNHAGNKTDDNNCFFKIGHNYKRIDLNSVSYFEACGNFTKVKLAEEVILVSESFASVNEKTGKDFLRIHKSFIVNLKRISEVKTKHVLIEKEELPIGNSYKKVFNETWERLLNNEN